MSWIKLVIHPEHEKVLRLADLTETAPDAAFVAAVRWFRWVDAHVESADTGISILSFRAVTRWPNDALATAKLHADVDRLTKGRDGLLRPTRPDTHFSGSAKRRAVHGRQVAHKRAQSVRSEGAPEKIRREEKPPPPPQSPVSVAEPPEGGGGGGEVVRMNPDQHAVYMALLTKPVWFVADAPWIDPVTCKDLALLPTTSMALVEYWMAQARSKRKGLKDAAGFVIARLKRPDMALAANMKTQSLTVSQIRERATQNGATA